MDNHVYDDIMIYFFVMIFNIALTKKWNIWESTNVMKYARTPVLIEENISDWQL